MGKTAHGEQANFTQKGVAYSFNNVETQKAEFHEEAQDNMDDHKSDPSTSQPEVILTNQLFHSFEHLAALTQKNTYW